MGNNNEQQSMITQTSPTPSHSLQGEPEQPVDTENAGPSSTQEGSRDQVGEASGNSSAAVGADAVLSKTQQKKALKRARFEEVKLIKRQAERARKKQRKQEFWEQKKIEVANGRISEDELKGKGKQLAQQPVRPYNISVVLDFGFDELMVEKEIVSLSSQLSHIYSSQRRSSYPVDNLYIVGHGSHPGTSFAEAKQLQLPPKARAPIASEKILDSALGQRMQSAWKGVWKRWKHLAILEAGGVEDLLTKEGSEGEGLQPQVPLKFLNELGGKHSPKQHQALRQRRLRREDVIYLTADSPHTLEVLEEGKTFVIGGIVDKNRYKNLCARKAEALGFATARLPINEKNLQLPDGRKLETRKVLTVNQVFDILLGWCETKDWPQALARTFPVRKLKPTSTPVSVSRILDGDASKIGADSDETASSPQEGDEGEVDAQAPQASAAVEQDEDDLFNSR
ncbi:hypothetical protein K437DRAFT_275258 [Tilletiaria anomala UBC 951]|uniref:tRNA (guanine(9)-N1)-methyltransferase n=1 Tax=Tilletiaria anomala (strain ATCC 24038 / CBS 436.72 / UBC 951) TaxID=1037660 RepID=A0A066VU36_TILAU|nr:uncharacterized protein K437DRAFT_275258 [Tilletiaria anomala UBC 951]KDN42080.1 hypothetical protein K437DRAFT_275258 [Tilletiaria anomala UBC 951]